MTSICPRLWKRSLRCQGADADLLGDLEHAEALATETENLLLCLCRDRQAP